MSDETIEIAPGFVTCDDCNRLLAKADGPTCKDCKSEARATARAAEKRASERQASAAEKSDKD